MTIRETLTEIALRRIVVLDGAMGTMIQRAGLDEADFRGERFADHPSDLKGDNDLLCLTRPDVVASIHDAYLAAGADVVSEGELKRVLKAGVPADKIMFSGIGKTDRELALAAGLVLAALVWSVVASSRYVERSSGDLAVRGSNRTAVFLGAWVGLLGLGVHCIVDFDLHVPGIAVTASLVTALLAACVRYSTERFWFKPGWVGCLLITAGAGALLWWMLPVAVRLGREALREPPRPRSVRNRANPRRNRRDR